MTFHDISKMPRPTAFNSAAMTCSSPILSLAARSSALILVKAWSGASRTMRSSIVTASSPDDSRRAANKVSASLMRQRYSVAQHRAAPTGGTQLAAQFLGTGTALCTDVDPRPTYAAAREPVVQDAWLPPAQDGRVPLLKLMIGGERRRIRGASDQLHAPGIQRFHDGALASTAASPPRKCSAQGPGMVIFGTIAPPLCVGRS